MGPPLPPLPSLQAILICDMVIKEAGTNKHSAIGIFTDVFTTKFPLVLNPLAVYASIGDAIGVYDLSIELVELAADRVIARVHGIKLQAKEKLASHDFGVRLVNTIFPRPGKYEFRLLADGRLVGSKTLNVREMPARPPEPPPPPP